MTCPRSLRRVVAESGTEPGQPGSGKHTPNHAVGSASTLQRSAEILLREQGGSVCLFPSIKLAKISRER